MSFSACRAARLALLIPALGCGHSASVPGAAADSSFAMMKERGAVVMGVDQDASEHIFEDLPDGGRVVFRMLDPADTTGVAVIRRHLRSIADSFSVGAFQGPAQVHGMVVPGSVEMARLRGEIRPVARDIPAGGELQISSTDASAIAAIHAFLAFQRMAHRAAGHDQMHQP